MSGLLCRMSILSKIAQPIKSIQPIPPFLPFLPPSFPLPSLPPTFKLITANGWHTAHQQIKLPLMSEQRPREQEQEGFQQFHDTEHDHGQLPELKTPQAIPQDNLYAVSAHKTPMKARGSRRKKSEVRIEIPLSLSPAQDKSLKLSSNSAKVETTPVRENRRFERIPIIRYQEECRYAGRVVYKNFVPRTSDNYLRLLKEVDWQCGSEKKRDIRNLHGIQFSSQFESGNLNLAIEYDLYMRVDSNTSGHRQWFYFSMRNERKCRVTLHIYRFKKLYSLFQRGMKPYARSRKSGKDWHPAGEAVTYHYERGGAKKEKKSFVLSFHYNFELDNDEVFIAAGIPYSYTFLQRQLSLYHSQADLRENLRFEVTVLCKSMCGLDLPVVTIQHRRRQLSQKRRFIIINTRTHSGQAAASWVLDGLLREAVEGDVQEWFLQEGICLKIMPMLNPDGVFIGNYRTGIVGDDFNRKFQTGRRQFYPEIFALKRLVAQCKKEGTVELFLDLHGHSILKNSFLYGPLEDYSAKFRLRTLPYHLLHNSKYFRLASCKFRAEKENVETARVYFQLKEDILAFTCQNSLGLYYNQCQTIQMLHSDWQAFGQTLLRSIVDALASQESPPHPRLLPPPQRTPIKSTMTREAQKRPKLPPSCKQAKGGLRLPTTNKSTAPAQQLDPIDNAFSFSTQISREDELMEPTQFSFHEKGSREGARLNMRRKSQIMKAPTSTVVQRIIGKTKIQSIRKNSAEEERMKLLNLGRSSTYDTSDTLKKEIDLANQQEEEAEGPQYEMEVINQNFSDDYVSMNDSDSQGDNLPEQEKIYLFEYIKANQQKIYEDEQPQRRPSEKEEESNKRIPSRDQKISHFRQIRFKSIEQLYEGEASQGLRITAGGKKPKLQPHHFKDNTSKSLIYKYNEIISQSEFDDPLLAFSQQKRLNERNPLRRPQKDPFVLFLRKDKQTE